MFGNDIVMKVLVILYLSAIICVLLYWLSISHIWPTLVKFWSKRFGKETEEKIKK